jgi:XTP/dITP diphosphohydrolase
MTTLLIATGNSHKIEEIRGILGDPFVYLSLKDLRDAPVVMEDADTFAGNAAKKALQLAAWLERQKQRSPPKSQPAGTYVLADDSGLEVDALGGAPGVYSARFAALDHKQTGNSTDADNNAKLLRLLQQVPLPQRTARFRCALALVQVDPPSPRRSPELFEGVCEGRIAQAPSGHAGFGYDSLFVPEGCEESFAELGTEVKNRVSHRARALVKLRERLLGLITPNQRPTPVS